MKRKGLKKRNGRESKYHLVKRVSKRRRREEGKAKKKRNIIRGGGINKCYTRASFCHLLASLCFLQNQRL